MNNQLHHMIALSLIPDIGPVLAKYLISYCGSAKDVFKSSKSALAKIPNIGPKTIEKIKSAQTFKLAEEQMQFLDKNGGQAITYLDPEYPQRLRHFDTAPVVLYTKGKMNFNPVRTVAIVGTRKPTEIGKILCEKIVEGLKPFGVQIISGLAFGIDTCAHKKCISSEIETIGILGHGLDMLYPASNRGLVQQMMLHGGVLTEFPTGSKPDREHFPMRNRIIAAMSDAVIVVESKKSGGSIITAEFANSFNKDVFAVPGRVNDETSEGCNKLIKQNKAHLLESAEDIAYIMRWEELDKERSVQRMLFVELSPDEQSLVDVLKQKEHCTIDELNYELKMHPSLLAAMLIDLEFKGIVRSLPGKKYILV